MCVAYHAQAHTHRHHTHTHTGLKQTTTTNRQEGRPNRGRLIICGCRLQCLHTLHNALPQKPHSPFSQQKTPKTKRSGLLVRLCSGVSQTQCPDAVSYGRRSGASKPLSSMQRDKLACKSTPKCGSLHILRLTRVHGRTELSKSSM